ncbi:MAG: sigma-70 family RNA polymerase sigma factor [Catenulispora sp.]|nr:sigma-70 family RNA polymerase sigma factor [Catenulispora sp.]
MHVDYTVDVETVAAARSGDQQALQELVEQCLPLVYNIAGRALDGAFDVDDVVQETMLQVVDSLQQLRSPERFRSWLVAITIQKIRDRWRNHQKRTAVGGLDEAHGTADPDADFVELTILRLGLSEQRREVAEATRWLEPGERALLSLWWLESAGELSRQELATALDLTSSHAAVRVQRMRARLDTARAVVRALSAAQSCADLTMLTGEWDGVPAPLWRKRFDRHLRGCPTCSRYQRDLMPAEGLLAGMALVPLPAGLAAGALSHLAGSQAGPAAGSMHASGAAHHAGAVSRRAARFGHHLAAKPAVALTTSALVLGGGAAIGLVALNQHAAPPSAVVTPVAPATPATPATPANQPSPTPARSSTSAIPIRPSTAASTPDHTLRYGQTVDQVDSPPRADVRPATLPTRPETRGVTISGKYAKPEGAGTYLLAHRGEYLTISGQGYFALSWQVGYSTRGPGQIRMPTWTALNGRIFHVASGGGHRMDDPVPEAAPGQTWMGSPEKGYSTLPTGTQQMWQNEYYYVDGTVTLHLNERGTDYNLIVGPTTRSGIVNDITQPPSPDRAKGRVRYGEVRDTGADDAPVPQYLTRSDPADPASVPEHSQVELAAP